MLKNDLLAACSFLFVSVSDAIGTVAQIVGMLAALFALFINYKNYFVTNENEQTFQHEKYNHVSNCLLCNKKIVSDNL